jgi:hypothetical protein
VQSLGLTQFSEHVLNDERIAREFTWLMEEQTKKTHQPMEGD